MFPNYPSIKHDGNAPLLQVVDGWELNGQFFPSADDHQLPVHNRYEAFCNSQKTPKKRVVYASSQNVAMLQFRMPKAGNWFQVSVRFVRNSQRKYTKLTETE